MRLSNARPGRLRRCLTRNWPSWNPRLTSSGSDLRTTTESTTTRTGTGQTHAMYWREEKRRGDEAARKWMEETFNDVYPRKGMVFAIGNQAKRPQTWQLLGVIRLDEAKQGELGI